MDIWFKFKGDSTICTITAYWGREARLCLQVSGGGGGDGTDIVHRKGVSKVLTVVKFDWGVLNRKLLI